MTAPAPEFPRPQPVAAIGPHGLTREVVADAAECAALARRLGIPALAALSCTFRLHALAGGVVEAEGALAARLTRECVVTLELFETEMDEAFRVRFVPEDALGDDEDAFDPESDDEIPYSGLAIDLGEAAAEQLALGLDPFPRMPGASLPAGEGDTAAASREDSPFAALARRRRPL